MQVYAERLANQLKQPLAPIYLVFGDEPFLVSECCDRIRKSARKQGYDERQRFTQDKEFNWDSLFHASHTLSLFTSKQIIELELPEAKPGREGSAALAEYATTQAPDQLLILFGGRLRKDQQKSKWFKALENNGVFVPVYAPDRNKLPAFVQQRAEKLGLAIDMPAIQQLCNWYEGNLLALSQALEKLKLLYPETTIDLDAVTAANEDSSRFDVFALRDALIQQKPKAFLHCLQRLLETGTEPVLIHWVLQSLHFTLIKIRKAMRQKQNLQPIWAAENIWQAQQEYYLQLARKDTPYRSQARIHLLERLELALKRDSGESSKVLASHIGLLFMPQLNQLDSLAAFTHSANYEDW
ncbi:DNA polymerase III subunit delta [Aliidiomarina iranensis]|uniref:DNA polymerase III subunit delta n=1 Tax=Aliidiomarina iranensis TaxID=1434071 RepID=A0A432VXB2_9GAMM|nr:DNA polymerase III subunit delta [Aliidiomarina iranensis]RUO21205.1 DNA polymerase III subunit delta [Aliidiomarina iranensis]